VPERRPLERRAGSGRPPAAHRSAAGPGTPPGGVRARARGAPGYPAGLCDLPDPPAHIYLLGGELPEVAGAVAIVGSRAASDYGVDQALRLAGDLARMGYVIVSGLARGIDAAAHRGALQAGGRTVAVIPSGLDAITPRHHHALAAEIAARGTLLSEREHGDPPGKHVFLERNRLIAALAAATVVVEAAARSGALSTAAAATRLGRAVLAVPGDVDRETARGCHRLLRSGATLCEQANDVLEAIGAAQRESAPGPGRRDAPAAPAAEAERTPEARVLAALDRLPRTVEALALAAALGVPETLAALLTLEWAGAAESRAGQRWTRRST
jgi:DNA processing protein